MDTVTLEKKGHQAIVTLNRAQAMNSYNEAMSHELLAVSETLLLDKKLRVVCLQGAGPVFMAGGDIAFFHQQLATLPKGLLGIIRRLGATILNLKQLPVPVVAAVHGAVAGAGLSLMLNCDLVVAHEATQFTTAYSALGLSPDGGMSHSLTKLVGRVKAAELLMLAERFDAKEALSLGLVNWVENDENYKATLKAKLQTLSQKPTKALAAIKQLLQASETLSLTEQLEREAFAFVECSQTADFNEGVCAFLDKRTPKFIGS